MIESSFEEAFSKEWVETQINDSTNELVILRQIIPWQAIIKQYNKQYPVLCNTMSKKLKVEGLTFNLKPSTLFFNQRQILIRLLALITFISIICLRENANN
jgi:hypothetical protein